MNWVDKWRGRFRRGDSTGSIDRFAINPFALRAGSPTPASAVSAASIRSTADSAVCRTAAAMAGSASQAVRYARTVHAASAVGARDRQSAVWGTRVTVGEELGGRRITKK